MIIKTMNVIDTNSTDVLKSEENYIIIYNTLYNILCLEMNITKHLKFTNESSKRSDKSNINIIDINTRKRIG